MSLRVTDPAASESVVPEPPAEVYPGAPLQAVAMEVYFRGLLDALPRLAAWQRAHAASYEQLVVPVDEEAANPLRPVILISTQEKRGVAVAVNQLTTIAYDYAGGYQAFAAWGVPCLLEGLQLLEVHQATRMAFRYENVVSLPSGQLEIEQFFRILLPRPEPVGGNTGSLALAWRYPWAKGEVAVDLAIAPHPDDSKARALLLTIVADRQRALAVGELEKGIDEVHRLARWTFERLITDEFRERLRKGTT